VKLTLSVGAHVTTFEFAYKRATPVCSILLLHGVNRWTAAALRQPQERVPGGRGSGSDQLNGDREWSRGRCRCRLCVRRCGWTSQHGLLDRYEPGDDQTCHTGDFAVIGHTCRRRGRLDWFDISRRSGVRLDRSQALLD